MAQVDSKIRCLIVSSMSADGRFIGAWMLLLLHQSSTPGTYVRVGLGCLLDVETFHKVCREVITIV